MDIIYRREEATAAEVLAELRDPPGYTTVRTLLRLLEKKGHVTHRRDGPRYVFSAIVPREEAQEAAMRQVLWTFFDGSVSKAMVGLLKMAGDHLSEGELRQLKVLVENFTRKER